MIKKCENCKFWEKGCYLSGQFYDYLLFHYKYDKNILFLKSGSQEYWDFIDDIKDNQYLFFEWVIYECKYIINKNRFNIFYQTHDILKNNKIIIPKKFNIKDKEISDKIIQCLEIYKKFWNDIYNLGTCHNIKKEMDYKNFKSINNTHVTSISNSQMTTGKNFCCINFISKKDK